MLLKFSSGLLHKSLRSLKRGRALESLPRWGLCFW